MIFVEGMLWMRSCSCSPCRCWVRWIRRWRRPRHLGADLRQTFQRVTLPLMRPSIVAVFLLALIRALESFEVPLLIGAPGNLHTLTTRSTRASIRVSCEIRRSERLCGAPAVHRRRAFGLLLPGYKSGRPLRDDHRQGLPAAPIEARHLAPSARIWLLLIPLSLAAPLLILVWASFLPIYKPPELADFGRLSLANYQAVWAGRRP